ncbi:Protein of unknown function [Novosphingobium sp. CF614]|uniref:DUF3237 domain-containing protein n=1 Tax=Novosphingobium sp. CF614 TaxID=1884364 RepID=UPI0008E7AE88|nr:DUF3237 domain-containing protein [Novosphingobium sp. CF614]SFG48277.1 Protein of unknown function [Novosphingobium sp. CF614]
MNEPSLELQYEHAFDIRINFDKRWMIGPIARELQVGYTSIGENCQVFGPLLNGRLVDYSGADWPLVRSDGVIELNAHYMIETDDGALIYINNRGYVHGPLRAPGQGADEAPAIPAYFRCTPYFRAPDGRHDWLNRTVMIGIGLRCPNLTEDDPPDHSLFRYYAVL